MTMVNITTICLVLILGTCQLSTITTGFAVIGSSSSRRMGYVLPATVVPGDGTVPLPSTTTDSCDTCKDGAEVFTKDKSTLLLRIDVPVTPEEITNQNLIQIVNLKCTDMECNHLAWKCLGYQYDAALDKFVLTPNVFPKWAAKYPEPPDLIGVTRNYMPEVDKVCRDASMNLMRSIPREWKGGVRELQNEGFVMYKLKDLTPNKTRRAQLVNWLMYYRDKLYGKTFEQLQAERMQEQARSEEIANLPSEKQFQKLRLDEAVTPTEKQ